MGIILSIVRRLYVVCSFPNGASTTNTVRANHSIRSILLKSRQVLAQAGEHVCGKCVVLLRVCPEAIRALRSPPCGERPTIRQRRMPRCAAKRPSTNTSPSRSRFQLHHPIAPRSLPTAAVRYCTMQYFMFSAPPESAPLHLLHRSRPRPPLIPPTSSRAMLSINCN